MVRTVVFAVVLAVAAAFSPAAQTQRRSAVVLQSEKARRGVEIIRYLAMSVVID